MGKGSIRVIKKDDTGKIIFDEIIGAVMSDNSVYFETPIQCNNGETLSIHQLHKQFPKGCLGCGCHEMYLLEDSEIKCVKCGTMYPDSTVLE